MGVKSTWPFCVSVPPRLTPTSHLLPNSLIPDSPERISHLRPNTPETTRLQENSSNPDNESRRSTTTGGSRTFLPYTVDNGSRCSATTAAGHPPQSSRRGRSPDPTPSAHPRMASTADTVNSCVTCPHRQSDSPEQIIRPTPTSLSPGASDNTPRHQHQHLTTAVARVTPSLPSNQPSDVQTDRPSHPQDSLTACD